MRDIHSRATQREANIRSLLVVHREWQQKPSLLMTQACERSSAIKLEGMQVAS